MRYSNKRVLLFLIVLGACCCLVVFRCMPRASTAGRDVQRRSTIVYEEKEGSAPHNVDAVPNLGKDETPDDIDFNIDRSFNIKGVKHVSRTIPKIVHFMWNNETVPTQFVDQLKSFPTNNEGWQYHFWTLKDGRSLIQKHHPELVQTYDNYTQDVMRADVLRYVVMYHFGGAYFDLDTWSLKPLDTVVVGEQCVVSPEPMEHAVFVLNMRSLLSNAVFLCSPKHTFFKFLIDELPGASSKRFEQYISGPVYFTNVFNKYITFFSDSNRIKEISESIHVIWYSVFMDRIKDDVHMVLKQKCPRIDPNKKELYEDFSCHRQTNPYAVEICRSLLNDRCRIEACERWTRRGGLKRVRSRLAITDHTYYGSYAHPKSIKYSSKNRIKNIIPTVNLYSDINTD